MILRITLTNWNLINHKRCHIGKISIGKSWQIFYNLLFLHFQRHELAKIKTFDEWIQFIAQPIQIHTRNCKIYLHAYWHIAMIQRKSLEVVVGCSNDLCIPMKGCLFFIKQTDMFFGTYTIYGIILNLADLHIVLSEWH